MIHLDTSVLIDALTGPRHKSELQAQAQLLPSDDAIVFDPQIAAIAADLYRRVRRPRGREIDLAIAACALAYDATLWTLDREDFGDIPGLALR